MGLSHVGGRFCFFLHEWRWITSDLFILRSIDGFQIEFAGSLPHMQHAPNRTFVRSKQDGLEVQAEIEILCAKRVIEKNSHEPHQFVSNIFTRQKKDGGYLIILDLTQLNTFVQYKHFKMESFVTAKQLISRGCYMACIDLKDAYYSVPVHKDHRKYLKFSWMGQQWQFKALPNGLTSAPRLFTKILKPALALLRA